MKSLMWVLAFFASFAISADEIQLRADSLQGGPRITFVINDNYLIGHALRRSTGNSDVVAFLNAAWNLSEQSYNELRAMPDESPSAYAQPEFLQTHGAYIAEIKALPEFQKVRALTLEYMRQSVNEWNRNLSTSLPFMNRYAGFDFEREFKVYITEPSIGNGRAFVRDGNIAFGANAEFSGYFTVYIWHEILHFYLPLTDESHVPIQLLTDNDLRIYLGRGSLLPLQGHRSSKPAMMRALRAWREYKKSPTDLNDFVRRYM